MNIQEITFL